MTGKDWECIVLAVAIVAGVVLCVIEWGAYALIVGVMAVLLALLVFIVANMLRMFIHPSREPWIPLGCYWPDNGRNKKE